MLPPGGGFHEKCEIGCSNQCSLQFSAAKCLLGMTFACCVRIALLTAALLRMGTAVTAQQIASTCGAACTVIKACAIHRVRRALYIGTSGLRLLYAAFQNKLLHTKTKTAVSPTQY